MADNVSITPGAGITVASDDVNIGGTQVQAQRVKIALGADGTYQKDLENGQTTKANSLPVTLASDQGKYATPTHTVISVTSSSTIALAVNVARLYALLINDSDTTIYLKMGAAAAANEGIRLNANGGSYEMSAELGNLYTGAIYAIHTGSGNKLLLVTEGV